jgi:hypothetical protein
VKGGEALERVVIGITAQSRGVDPSDGAACIVLQKFTHYNGARRTLRNASIDIRATGHHLSIFIMCVLIALHA